MKHATIELNLWVAIILVVVVVGSVVYGWQASEWTKMYLYPKTGIVTRINRATKIITITDSFGNDWEWEDESVAGWTRGDRVSMIMHSNRTPETEKDDMIVKIRYEGYAGK